MEIRSLKQTSPGRFTIELEDGVCIRSTLAVVTDLRLFVGRSLDDGQLDELRLSSEKALARERALEMLSRRTMSRKELSGKLLEKGYTPEVAEYCTQWLCDNGFINEDYYAGAVARHYAAKGYGAGRIKAELSRRGLSRELWDQALSELPEPDEKIDRFIASRLRDPEDREQTRKITAALYRRGYSWDEIKAALNRFGAEEHGDY